MLISEHPRTPGKRHDSGNALDGSFCAVSEPVRSELRSITSFSTYRRGSTIYMEGQPAKGVYILDSGRVKLSACSEEGKVIIFKIAGAGELLALSAVLTNSPHEKSARAIEDSTIGLVKKRDFLRFIETNPEVAMIALHQLSRNYQAAYRQICSFGLSTSTANKLVTLLLDWCESEPNGGPIRIRRVFTHCEIAEMIGSSRETVTRVLSSFKNRGLVNFSKGEIVIPDWKKLKATTSSKP